VIILLKAVLFDFDGVILETSDQLFQGYKMVFNRLGIKYSEKKFNILYGLKTKEHFRKILVDSNVFLSDDELDKLVEERDFHYRQICSRDLTPLPGAIKLLKALKQNKIKIGLATSTSKKNIDFFLIKLEIKDFFNQVLAGTEVSKGKPDPEIYLNTCLKLNVAPENSVGIEDTEIGITSLHNAKMKSIAVTLTNRKKYDFSKADLVVKTLEEVNVKIILSLF
jgi:beta-phosphoglucomutase